MDDIIFESTNDNLCKRFAKLMQSKFEMSLMGELKFFLGLQVDQRLDGIFIFQSKYLKELLKKYNMEDSASARTPSSTAVKLGACDNFYQGRCLKLQRYDRFITCILLQVDMILCMLHAYVQGSKRILEIYISLL